MVRGEATGGHGRKRWTMRKVKYLLLESHQLWILCPGWRLEIRRRGRRGALAISLGGAMTLGQLRMRVEGSSAGVAAVAGKVGVEVVVEVGAEGA